MRPKKLKRIRASQILIFKIKNRQGYAAICMNNLTEGKNPREAVNRLHHPLRRLGYAIPD